MDNIYTSFTKEQEKVDTLEHKLVTPSTEPTSKTLQMLQQFARIYQPRSCKAGIAVS